MDLQQRGDEVEADLAITLLLAAFARTSPITCKEFTACTVLSIHQAVLPVTWLCIFPWNKFLYVNEIKLFIEQIPTKFLIMHSPNSV